MTMSFDTWLALFVFAIVTSATPGPNTLMLLASGVNFGFKRTLPHMVGIVSGFCLLLLCVGFGLGVLLTTFPPLYTVLKGVGAGYLLFLAWRVANAGALKGPDTKAAPMSVIAAMLFQWVNPKAWMMAVTAMAIYTQAQSPYLSVITIAAVYGLVGIPTALLWSGFGAMLRGWLENPVRLKWFNRTMGALLALTVVPLVQ